MKYKTYNLIWSLIFGLLTIGIVCVMVYQINFPEQEDTQTIIYKITPEQKAELLCPFKCIDAGYDGGEYLRVASKCFCYNKTK